MWSRNFTSGYLNEENKNTNLKDLCTSMFTAALLTLVKIWKQPMFSQMINEYNKYVTCIESGIKS